MCVAEAPGCTAVTDLYVTLFHVCARSRDTRASEAPSGWTSCVIFLNVINLVHMLPALHWRMRDVAIPSAIMGTYSFSSHLLFWQKRFLRLMLYKYSSIDAILMRLLKTALVKTRRGGKYPFAMFWRGH